MISHSGAAGRGPRFLPGGVKCPISLLRRSKSSEPNNVNLVEFLRRQGEKLIPSGQDKRMASDHSITVRGNEWYDHESKEGGHAISFVQTYYGLDLP